MKYSQLIDTLQNVTKSKVNLKEIADIIGIPVRTLYTRSQRNSNFTIGEIKKIETFYDIQLFNTDKTENKNTLERCYNPDIINKIKDFGKRIFDIQTQNNLSNYQMAGILDVSTEEFNNIINCYTVPNFNIINNLKQNFRVSVDWLLYGE